MTCKQCKIKPVWEFTNQTKLCKNCFIDYIEKKVFKTIRKYNMLESNLQEIKLKKESTINYNLLKHILQKKFKVKSGDKFCSENLSQVAEKTFENILAGNYKKILPIKPSKPLYLVSDKEIEIYVNIKKISGAKRKVNKRIQILFENFLKKNQDLEINIVRAMEQL